MKSSRAQRGTALITAVIMIAVILGIVAVLMMYANDERRRAIINSRVAIQRSCAESGLQVARAFFGWNSANWDTYLSSPSIYDPIPSTFNPTPANPTDANFQASRPELFADLDGDSLVDVYIYVRDNLDEFPPLTPNWARDNDRNVIVGAICVSSTMTPRNSRDADIQPLTAEGLLSHTHVAGGCLQANCGTGTGNLN